MSANLFHQQRKVTLHQKCVRPVDCGLTQSVHWSSWFPGCGCEIAAELNGWQSFWSLHSTWNQVHHSQLTLEQKRTMRLLITKIEISSSGGGGLKAAVKRFSLVMEQVKIKYTGQDHQKRDFFFLFYYLVLLSVLKSVWDMYCHFLTTLTVKMSSNH